MVDNSMPGKLVVPETILQPLVKASNSSDLDKGLEHLIEVAKSPEGRADLASKDLVTYVLKLCQLPDFVSSGDLLFLSLKLLRNLCAGELINQNAFLEQNGVKVVSSVLSCVSFSSEFGYKIIRTCLQVLGNFSLAGEEHQLAVWREFFPLSFTKIAEVQRTDTCDPLCMVTYACSGESNELLEELCSVRGLRLVVEIVRTVSAVGFKEDWFKLILSRVCIDKSCFTSVFSQLYPISQVEEHGNITSKAVGFSAEQSFLMEVLSIILNERIRDKVNSTELALCVFEILRASVSLLGSVPRGSTGLPTGNTDIDILGYSLLILRDVCSNDNLTSLKERGSGDVVDLLVYAGLIEFLLNLLRKLEPPSTIKKAMKVQETSNKAGSQPCPYKGFRKDIVSILANCAYQRKSVQDEIREKNGILLLLQQCIHDDDNPFLREWGLWSLRNLLEGNLENQQVVAGLELQGSVDVPEIADLGLRVELDPQTRRPKLRNV
ncbi:OLC1v1039038C1 [Oldenlandia corymbosa var. corymbosa]|uniref:OLC1v1039038C1 n=1 Tax=Oldenlandia corymbosa var. corymbosa TaxID=529605 RepID=A0AAV1D261_OLDCO|nr:OLC1v1039038C1 [Oldenlandia corymbosa var. corymbosa]